MEAVQKASPQAHLKGIPSESWLLHTMLHQGIDVSDLHGINPNA